ncbi:MAG TPA: hypothetical protein VGH51_16750 [Candidatus Angelobacter sp.]|jgi:hypothetical protein
MMPVETLSRTHPEYALPDLAMVNRVLTVQIEVHEAAICLDVLLA